MRRISLAFALAGAIAAVGCGGNVSPSKTGSGKGVKDGYFTVTVQNGQNQTRDPVTGKLPLELLGGKVVSTPAGIDCGEGGDVTKCTATFPLGSSVTLTAQPAGSNVLLSWSGNCSGWDVNCALDATSNADKYIVAQFGAADSWTAHPNWADASVHGPLYFNQTYTCTNCHGTTLAGAGTAPSCGACHENPASFAATGHFDPNAQPWGTHEGQGWAQACQRCHTDQGFRDFMGELKAPGETAPSADYLTATQGTNALPTPPAAGATTDSYSYGPLKCGTCHNTVTDAITAGVTKVKFPSGVIVTTDKATALCAQCHQARESSVSVDTVVAPAAGPDAQIDATKGVSFKNGHYLGAGATLFGSVAKGWAQYGSNVYTGQNVHGGVGSCTYCHSPHDGSLPADGTAIQEKCGKCHFDEVTGQPVTSFLSLEESRQFGFEGDVDGDGNVESIRAEVDGIAAKLYEAMQAYATNVAGTPVCYVQASYPYFFKDNGANGGIANDGICQPGELDNDTDPTNTPNTQQFKQFTPRLMRAAYNYNWYKREPGAWAHNPRYAIEVMFDGIWDLNAGLAAAGKTQVTFTGFRSFDGHFGAANFAQEPYAQFLYHPAAGAKAGTGFTGSTCYQCHGGQGGFEAYLSRSPVSAPAASDCIGAAPCAVAAGGQPDAVLTPGTYLTYTNRVTGMQCTTCHAPVTETAPNFKGLRTVSALYLAPQKGAPGTNGVVKFDAANLPPSFTLCGSCHTGLENKASVDAKIAAMADPTKFTAGFVNGHYFGAAGIILGTNAKVLYEYPSKTYQGTPVNWSTTASGPHGSPHGARCIGCHNPQASKHSFQIDLATTVPNGLEKVYPDTTWTQNTRACADCHTGAYDLAPTAAKLQTLGGDLLTAMKSYALANNGGVALCYSASSYPYFLKDLDGNGVCNDAELSRSNGYAFDAKLLRAAYNYQWFIKDPGAAEHNFQYIGQVLFDAIEDLGGTTTEVRPVNVQ